MVHRWDAQRSVGEPEAIDPALAADGIDEFFEWMFDPEEARGFEGSVGVELAPTDTDATLVLSVRDGRLDLAGDAVAVDVTVRASMSDLLLLLWRRVVPDDVQIEGDQSALERFLSIVDLS
ncbi:MAG: SCP2 sterol-binding domain-containing protein [Actinomycetota bacterium]